MRTRLRSKVTLLFLAFAFMMALPAAAWADATLDTSADLSTSVSTPTNVQIGSNSFNIKVWATNGNIPGKTGLVDIGNAYSMAPDGTITKTGTTLVTFEDMNYSQCPSTGNIPKGCPGNPFVVPATLTVAPNTPDGKTGLLTVFNSAASGSGLNADASPATGQVKVVNPQPQKQNQTITFGALSSKTYGDPHFNASATASSNLPVSFSASGNCTISGNTVSITGAGNCDISASQAGNDNYNPAPNVTQSFSIAKADPTIDVKGYTGVYDGDAHGATGSAKGINGEDLSTLLDVGAKFTDFPGGTANWTFAGNANYNSKSGTAQIDISKAPSTTTVTCSGGPFTYNGQPHTPCSVSVTGAGGLNQSPAPDYSDNVNAGTAKASYTFAGDDNHTGSNDSKTFEIDKANATIDVQDYTGTYDGQAHGATGTATGVGGADLSSLLHLGASFTDVPGGTAHWTFDGNANYNQASGDVQIVINKASQTINFGTLSEKIVGAADFNVSATASSGLPVSFVASPNATCTISGNAVHITGVGTCTITASQAGNGNYNAAPDVPQTFKVTYNFGGFLQPINDTAHDLSGNPNVSTFKLGSTVPVKFRLTDAKGNAVQAGSAQWIAPQQSGATSQAVDESVYTDPATSGSLCKWDPTAQQYIYNWSTKGMASGSYYKIGVKLDDGKTYYTYISLR